jgi:hypothetical protein
VQRCKSERSSCAKVERWKYEKGAKRGTGDRKVSAGGGRVVEVRTSIGERTRRSRAPTRGRSPREAARLVRSPNPTRYKGEGFREWGLGARG